MTRCGRWLACLACLVWLCVACAAPWGMTPPPACRNDCVRVDIIDHGWHAGLALDVADLPPGLVPETADFADADYLEFGWGDRDYYRADAPGLWLTLKAGGWSDASVLHVTGFRGDFQRQYAGRSFRLDLRRDGFLRLVRYIDQSVDRQGRARAPALDPDPARGSRFYPARGRFHLFHTCNGWIAGGLAAAGLSLGSPDPVTAYGLMTRLRRVGASTGE